MLRALYAVFKGIQSCDFMAVCDTTVTTLKGKCFVAQFGR
jgi:hypothetical protein